MSYAVALIEFDSQPLWLTIPALGLIWLLVWGAFQAALAYNEIYGGDKK